MCKWNAFTIDSAGNTCKDVHCRQGKIFTTSPKKRTELVHDRKDSHARGRRSQSLASSLRGGPTSLGYFGKVITCRRPQRRSCAGQRASTPLLGDPRIQGKRRTESFQ